MIVRTALATAFALGTMTSVALAEEPIALTDAQLDGVTAGQPADADVFAEFFFPGFGPENENLTIQLAGGGEGGVSQSSDVEQNNVTLFLDVNDIINLANFQGGDEE